MVMSAGGENWQKFYLVNTEGEEINIGSGCAKVYLAVEPPRQGGELLTVPLFSNHSSIVIVCR